jgi:putative sigma-54 modulation protein
MMDIKIAAKNITISDDIRDHIDKKVGKLGKYLSNITSIKMELCEEKAKSKQNIYSAQVTMNVNGVLLRGEQKEENLKSVIDAVTDVMERQIDKYKKRYTVNKARGHESIRTTADDAVDDERPLEHVVKRKKFPVKPMKIEHAIDQMEFLGHDFFLFANDDDNSINVIYRRKDGFYGLIQPEFD